ncbi:MAG: citrate lyase holo-[acyl-carrier protein] synthase [Fusobacteriaceae bacterium]
MSYNKNFSLEDFLQERENRVERQMQLLERFNSPLLVVRCNFPGKDKKQYPSMEIVSEITKVIDQILQKKIIYKDMHETLEGKISTFVIDIELFELKRKMIYLEENHLLGRFVDIDVYGESGHSISRRDLGYTPRKCYLCDELSVICTREMAHSHEEIKRHILKSYEKYLDFKMERDKIGEKFGDLVLKACLMEVSCYPSFGLVSPISRGSHQDMDYFTFLDSSFAIKDGLKEMGKLGYSSMEPIDIFAISRKIGIRSEREMFLATKGVNTHKGMIFLLGVVIQVMGKVFYECRALQDKISELDFYSLIGEGVRNISKDILDDFENIPQKVRDGKKLTNGEKLYLKHGFLGIRGEVKEGLTVVFEEALPVLKNSLLKGEEVNISLVKTLLKLMSRVEDSTIVNRKGIDVLKAVQKEADELFNKFTLEEACLMEGRYIADRISPGGSADLLALTILLHEGYKVYTLI